jgi:hypothetical protein
MKKTMKLLDEYKKMTAYTVVMLQVSKIIRKINKVPTPKPCFAALHLPESLQQVCDCQDECKFNPKGHAPIFINTLMKPSQLQISFSLMS